MYQKAVVPKAGRAGAAGTAGFVLVLVVPPLVGTALVVVVRPFVHKLKIITLCILYIIQNHI